MLPTIKLLGARSHQHTTKTKPENLHDHTRFTTKDLGTTPPAGPGRGRCGQDLIIRLSGHSRPFSASSKWRKGSPIWFSFILNFTDFSVFCGKHYLSSFTYSFFHGTCWFVHSVEDPNLISCQNGGTRVQQRTTDGNVQWVCTCPVKFTGATCETREYYLILLI